MNMNAAMESIPIFFNKFFIHSSLRFNLLSVYDFRIRRYFLSTKIYLSFQPENCNRFWPDMQGDGHVAVVIDILAFIRTLPFIYGSFGYIEFAGDIGHRSVFCVVQNFVLLSP